MQHMVKQQKHNNTVKKYKRKVMKKEYIRECDQISVPMEWISISDILRYISSQGISVFIMDMSSTQKYFIDRKEMTEVESLIYANKIRLKKRLPPFHLESVTNE